jgi:hypothetical protein
VNPSNRLAPTGDHSRSSSTSISRCGGRFPVVLLSRPVLRIRVAFIPDPDQTIYSSRIWIQTFVHPGSYMKTRMQTYRYIFLASHAFRRKVLFLVMVKKIRYPGSGKNLFIPYPDPGSGSLIQGLKSTGSRIQGC